MSKTQIILNRINIEFKDYKCGVHTIKTMSNKQKLNVFRDFVKQENKNFFDNKKRYNKNYNTNKKTVSKKR